MKNELITALLIVLMAILLWPTVIQRELNREEIASHIRAADVLAQHGMLVEAKAHLERVVGSKLLTAAERDLIMEGLKRIENESNGNRRRV